MDEHSVYDSKEGIAIFLGTYEEFYELCQARRRMDELSSQDGQLLDCFYVLGRFRLDRWGNFAIIDHVDATAQLQAAMAPVMTEDEYLALLKQMPPPYPSLTMQVPRRPDVACAGCGEGWTIEDCHEAVPSQTGVAMSLEGYAGKTLGQITKEYGARTDGEYRISLSIQNLLRVNDPIEGFGWDEDGICDQYSDPPMSLDYVVQPGDEGAMLVTKWFHTSCHAASECIAAHQKSIETMVQFRKLFADAGFDDVIVEKESLPPHIVDWLRRDIGEDFDSEAASASDELVYMLVQTKQGQLGICMLSYPAFDLTGTGIAPAELNPQLADFPPDMPPLVGFDGSPELFLRLWQLMTKRKSA